jgi:elongation factor Ts
MAVSMKDIKALRERTGAGILDCKKALAESNGDVDGAIDWLRAKGIAKAAKKSGRSATEGLVAAYIHGGGRMGVLVEVNCETDFVAMNDGFKAFVDDIAMQIAASAPSYVRREEVPQEAIDKEMAVQLAKLQEEGEKPAKMPQDRWDMIQKKKIEGRMRNWYADECLLEQPFIKEDKKTVAEVLADKVATIGENIQIRRFERFVLGEGLEKKVDNLAEEVAKMTAQA